MHFAKTNLVSKRNQCSSSDLIKIKVLWVVGLKLLIYMGSCWGWKWQYTKGLFKFWSSLLWTWECFWLGSWGPQFWLLIPSGASLGFILFYFIFLLLLFWFNCWNAKHKLLEVVWVEICVFLWSISNLFLVWIIICNGFFNLVLFYLFIFTFNKVL
jgi:hypothetical protein